MSDTIKGLTVMLRPDMRDDDAECVINAIRMVKGVVDVKSHVADMNHHFAVQTAKLEMRKKLQELLE